MKEVRRCKSIKRSLGKKQGEEQGEAKDPGQGKQGARQGVDGRGQGGVAVVAHSTPTVGRFPTPLR